MSNSVSASLRSRRGTAAVEFALVGAIFFITMLAAIEVGRYFMTLQGLRNYASDAMRWGIVNMTPGQTLCRQDLLAAMGRGGTVGGLVSTTPGVCVTRSDAVTPGSTTVTISVTTSVSYRFLINVFGIGTQTIRDDATLTFQL